MFSKSTEYALRATIFIAKYGTIEAKLSIAKISKAIGSPKSFTAKILQKLTQDNILIHSSPGPNGGFYMTTESKSCNLMKTLAILNEDSVVTKCVLGLQECSELNPCPMHERYKHIKPLLIEMFEEKTIDDLVKDIPDSKLILII